MREKPTQNRLACALLACTTICFAPAYAAHPLVTDDPGTQGADKHQIEINTDHLRGAAGRSKISTLTYTYGINDGLDIYLNAPYTISRPAGINDVGVGVKWRFYENEGWSLAIKPELLMPSGDAARGLGSGRPGLSLLGILSVELGDWQILANMGISETRYRLAADRNTFHHAGWNLSAAAIYQVNEQWKIAGDIGMARNPERTGSGTLSYMLLGLIYSPTPQLDLDIGVRRGLNCNACTSQIRRQVGAGLTWRF